MVSTLQLCVNAPYILWSHLNGWHFHCRVTTPKTGVLGNQILKGDAKGRKPFNDWRRKATRDYPNLGFLWLRAFSGTFVRRKRKSLRNPLVLSISTVWVCKSEDVREKLNECNGYSPHENFTCHFAYENSISCVRMVQFRTWYENFICEINFHVWIFHFKCKFCFEYQRLTCEILNQFISQYELGILCVKTSPI